MKKEKEEEEVEKEEEETRAPSRIGSKKRRSGRRTSMRRWPLFISPYFL